MKQIYSLGLPYDYDEQVEVAENNSQYSWSIYSLIVNYYLQVLPVIKSVLF